MVGAVALRATATHTNIKPIHAPSSRSDGHRGLSRIRGDQVELFHSVDGWLRLYLWSMTKLVPVAPARPGRDPNPTDSNSQHLSVIGGAEADDVPFSCFLPFHFISLVDALATRHPSLERSPFSEGHLASTCPKAGTPTCYNCSQEGHLSRDCPAERKAKACYKCGDEGHLSRECPQNPQAGQGYGAAPGGYSAGGQQCYKCNQVGHISRNCPQNQGQGAYGYGGQQQQGAYGGGNFGAGNFGGPAKTCYTCGGVGHLSRDCTTQQKCFNCGQGGHISRECSQAPQAKACYNCGQPGHISRECPSQGGAPAEGL